MLVKHFFWDYSGRILTILIGLIITGILSRILTPAEYGVMGLVMAVSGMASLFQDFGFSSAIVQRQNISKEQLSTIFFLNVGAGLLIYILIFLLANPIADYYQKSELGLILRVSGLTFLVNPMNLVPGALITKNMQFKQQAIRQGIITLLVGSVSIWMAFHGWGIWSLVIQSLLGASLGLWINLIITGWRPQFICKLKSISTIFRYSGFMFLSSFLNTVFTRIDIFLIGKVLSFSILGHYTRAQSMDNLVKGVSSSSLLSVMFPYFSKIQNNDGLIIQQWEKSWKLICAAYFLITGLAYIGSTYIFLLIFGMNWSDSADFYKIIALTGFIYPLSSLALTIIEAKGNSKDFFFVEILKKIVVLPTFFIAFFYGIKPYLYSVLVFCLVAYILNLLYLKRSIAFSIIKHLFGVGQYIFVLAAFLLFFGIWDFRYFLNSESFLVTASMCLLFIVYYFSFLWFFEKETFSFLKDKLKLFKNKAE